MTPRPPGSIRHFASLGTLVVLGLALFVQACTQREIVGVKTGSVTVSPQTATISEGGTIQLTAIVRDQDGDVLDNAIPEWTSLHPGIASVDQNGLVTGLLRGTATIEAKHNGVTGTAQVEVQQAAGITATAISGPTTEGGGTATFTVKLDSRPDANVTIALSSSDETEGSVSPTSLTFTPDDWDVPKTVTVTGQNDDVADGNVTYTIVLAPAVSTDPRYDGLDADDVQVTNNDDDLPGVVVSPINKPTTEAGGVAQFTIVLTTQPTADVMIALSSSDPTEGVVNVPSVTFTPTTWNVPQTIIVTGKNDPEADGNIDYFIVTAPAVSADPNYDGVDPPDVPVTNVDDETAGITVSAPSGPTTEAGGQATFTVVLNAAPIGDVTITIALASSDVTEGTISTPTLVFTPQNWNVAQTVTVTGVDDHVDDGDQTYTVILSPASSADPNYDGLDPDDVTITNVDDDTAGITVSPPTGPTTEGGGTASFTVVLNSEPTADVTLTFSSSELAEATVLTGPITFTSEDWNVARQVVVQGLDDDVADGNVAYYVIIPPATSADPLYGGLDAPDVPMTNVDDETPGITLSPPSGPTTEAGGTASFTVVLSTQPTEPVVIELSSSDTSEGTVAPTSLTFNPSGAGAWNVSQTVTVTGQDDHVDDGDVVFTIVTSLAVSSDPNYSGLDPADVSITNVDDDTAGFTVSPISGPTTEAGGTATFQIALTSEPTADVTVTVLSSDETEGVVTIPADGTLTFTAGTWSTPQMVTVRGEDDLTTDRNIVYTIILQATSADPIYEALDPPDVSVTNVDDETPGITVTPMNQPTTEAGGEAFFTVVLNNEPAADVTIAISSSDETEGVVSVTSLTFTPSNWNQAQVVTITGVDDFVDDDNVVYTIITAPSVSADPNYDDIDAADVTVTNVDDDTAGFTVSAISGPTTEAGGTATFTIRLNSEPTANVTIGLSSNNEDEGTVSPSTITFTPSGANSWNNPVTVTVTGVDDEIDDGNVVYRIITAPAASLDPKYDGLNPPNVSVTNVDDDQAGIVVSPPSGPTTEAGGQATFTVVLTSEPTADVTIGISSSHETEGVVSVTSLTFTPADWNQPQTVVVTGVDDQVDDGNAMYTIVTAPATSTDPLYDEMDAADVPMTNVDDEEAGIIVSPISGPTTERGGQATFTIRLATAPAADVVIGLSSSDPGEGTVSPSSLTFTTANWSAPQSVTVTGVDDTEQDGNVPYTIVLAPAVAPGDSNYDGMDAADVSVTNIDDETAGITVSAISGPTTEDGGTATFTIRLNSQPSGDVTIPLSSSDDTEGTVDRASVTFTSANWETPVTIVVTGVDDDMDDGNVAYTIVTGAATSSDALYDDLDPEDVAVTNVDDDVAGVTVSPPSGPTSEEGASAQFTVRLNSEPTATVTITAVSNDPTEGVVTSGSTLEFDASNWSTEQTVTVTGVNDAIDDDFVSYGIQLSASSADGLYNGIAISDVPITNVDDADAARIIVSPTTGLVTTEAGATAQFTVVLNSEPIAPVSITLSSSDPTEGQVTSANPLVFDASNWNVAQTVTVTGQDDFIDDGTVAYTIVTAPAVSADAKYNGRNAADVAAENEDAGDTAGITVTAAAVLITTESGGQATFTIELDTEPTDTVTISISSSDTTEGTVSPSVLTFTPEAGPNAWNIPHVVTVTGVNDNLDDGDIPYTIVTAQASSADPLYAAIDPPNVSVINEDDDTAGILVTPTSGLVTTEGGGQATFSIVLNSEPTANVTINLSSSDLTEGTINPSSVTFTPSGANIWSTPRTITVTGVDDLTEDGNVVYTIVTAQASSADPLYAAINPADVSVTNVDDDTAGITVTPTSGLVTTEGGGQATFSIVLNSEPTANVTINLSSSDLTEGTVNPSSVTFTPSGANIWSTPRTITVSGVDDLIDDGNVAYTIVTAQASSTDPLYAAINPADVSVTNTDDDTAGVIVTPATGLVTTEVGGTATFDIRLNSEPTADVTINFSSSDLTEGTVSPSSVTFTPSGANIWSTPQTITVTGVDDVIDDGDVPYWIVTSQASSTDPLYAAIDPPDVSVTNIDDDDALIVIDDPVVTEGNTGTVNAHFTVTKSIASSQTVTVSFATSDGSATAGSDYVASSGTLTFTPGGPLTDTITVVVNGDYIDEVNETFNVTLSNPTGGATLSKATGIGTITDDDTNDFVVAHFDGATTVHELVGPNNVDSISVVLTAQPVGTVVFDVSSSDPGEFTLDLGQTTTTLTFDADNWDQPQVIRIFGVNDETVDGDQNVQVSVAVNPVQSHDAWDALGTKNLTVTVIDGHEPGILTMGEPIVATEGGPNDTLSVRLQARPLGNVVINITVVDPDTGNPTIQGSVVPTSLVFTPANWDEWQDVEVIAYDGNVADGPFTAHIVFSIDPSSDDLWLGVPDEVVEALIVDNDDPL